MAFGNYDVREIDQIAQFLKDYAAYYTKQRPAILAACELALDGENDPDAQNKREKLDELAIELNCMRNHFALANDATSGNLNAAELDKFNQSIIDDSFIPRFRTEFSGDHIEKIQDFLNELKYELEIKLHHAHEKLDESTASAKPGAIALQDQLETAVTKLSSAYEAAKTLSTQFARYQFALDTQYTKMAAIKLDELLEDHCKKLVSQPQTDEPVKNVKITKTRQPARERD